MATERESVTIAPDCLDRLTAALAAKWADQSTDWDKRVEGNAPTGGSLGLWDLPSIDSKTLHAWHRLFKEHLEVPFGVKHIRPGGYGGIAEVVADLVPKLTGCKLPAAFAANANGRSHDEQSTS